MYSPDSAFTGRHPVVGPYPARMTRTRNYEFDFMSCFSKHISDYEKAGRKGSAANYRSSYRLLLSFLDGQHLTSQHLSARWAERYERWLRARGRDNQHGDVPPAQPEGSLQPIRKKTAHTGLISQSLHPSDRQADRNAQTGALTRNHQTDMHGRPLGAASQVLPRTRHLHVQFLHPRHVVRRYGLPAQQRHP